MTSQHRPKDCGTTLRLLDDFLAGELTIECNQGILSHLEACPKCEAERQLRQQLRADFQASWTRRTAPPELRQRVLAEIDSAVPSRGSSSILRWAAGLVLALGSALLFSQAWFSMSVEAVDHFDQALRDHIECQHPQQVPLATLPISDPQLRELQERLSSILADDAGTEEFNAFYGHRCEKDGVTFIHYKFCHRGSSEIVPCRGEEKSVSLILERRARMQVLDEHDGASRLHLENTPASLFVNDELSMVSFEGDHFFVYIVTDRISPQPFALGAAYGILSTLGGSL